MEVLFFMFVFFIFDHERRPVCTERFLRRYNQFYPEMPLRLFGVPVLMLACAGNSGCNNK